MKNFLKKNWYNAIGLAVLTGVSSLVYVNRVYNNQLAQAFSTAAQPEKAQLIVALTGGPGRVKTALQMAGPGQAVFISGCNPNVKVSDICKANKIDVRTLNIPLNQIYLGKDALDTRGNALEIAAVLKKNPHIKHVAIVTAYDHVPRIRLELSRLDLPAGVLISYEPVGEAPGLIEKEAFKTTLVSMGFGTGTPLRSMEENQDSPRYSQR